MTKAHPASDFLADRVRSFEPGCRSVISQIAAKSVGIAGQFRDVVIARHEEAELLVGAGVDDVGVRLRRSPGFRT